MTPPLTVLLVAGCCGIAGAVGLIVFGRVRRPCVRRRRPAGDAPSRARPPQRTDHLSRPPVHAHPTDTMIRLAVLAVGHDQDGAEPVVLLREMCGGGRVLPIRVAPIDAEGLHRAHQNRGRPGAHDLFDRVVGNFGQRLCRVDIVGCHAGVFYAQLMFDDGAIVSARPSDALVLAMQVDAPVHTTDALLRVVGLPAARVALDTSAVTATACDAATGPDTSNSTHLGAPETSDRQVRERVAVVSAASLLGYRPARPASRTN